MRTTTGALARLGERGGHRGHETVETRLPGELRMERRGDDLALLHGDDAAVIELGDHVDVGADTLD